MTSLDTLPQHWPAPENTDLMATYPPAPRLARTQFLWLAGDFPSVNQLQESLRAEGFAAGVSHYERHRRRAKGQRPPARHAIEVRRLRSYAAAVARRARLDPVPPERWVRLAFSLIGHPRYDADAWYLAAKHVTDGLQDAGVIARDGTDVHSTEGRVVHSREEAHVLLERAGVPQVGPGLLVEIQPWG